MNIKKCGATAAVITFLALIAMLFCGCSTSSEANILQMKYLADSVEQAIMSYDNKLAGMEGAISDIQVILADPNLAVPAREEMQAGIARVLAAKAVVDSKKVIALNLLQTTRARITELEADGIQPGEDLIAFGEGLTNVGKSLPPPVGPILLLIGAIVGGIGEARRRGAVKVARGVVASVNAVLADESYSVNAAKAKTILKNTQRELGVREGVKKLLDT